MTTLSMLEALVQRCESEQLNLSGAIQSFGALIRIDSNSGTVTHVSSNLADFTGTDPAKALGQNLETLNFFPVVPLLALPDQPGKRLRVDTVAEFMGSRVEVLAVRGVDFILIEIERSAVPSAPIPVQQLQSPLLSVPYDDDEVMEHHNMLVQAFQTVTGFDRVMIYRFQEDWSGEVISEATTKALGSYLGLRFPASDIPAIARNLYILNPCRMIPDATAQPVPLLGLGDAPADLAWSDLRSVSPVHLEYLNHMGVGASFSVPIRVTGKLWGLVACHSLKPHLLSHDQRSACVSLTNAYSLGLTSHFAGRRIQSLDSLDRRIEKILEALAQHEDPLDGIDKMKDQLMEAMAAQGFAMAIGNDVVITGEAPDLDGMGLIDDWFLNESRDTVVISDHLDDLFHGQVVLLAVVSGMVAIKARSLRSGWVRFYWFRPALAQEVAWAGNPNKPVVEKAGVVMLSPRRSFEKWIEVKSGFSRPWTNDERMTAARFRNTLLQWL
jgi:chemotaxis family two-component system sensor kinase Cph1